MARDEAPKPYQAKSLLDFIDREVLVQLITGFREKLQMGVTLYCRPKEEGKEWERIDPTESDPEEKGRFWPALCRWFRSDEDRNKQCHCFDEAVAEEYMWDGYIPARYHECEPLGLYDMAAPIMVGERPMGVVLAGQRIPADTDSQERVREDLVVKVPDGVQEAQEEFDKDVRDDGHVCSEEEMEALVEKLQQFATLIADLCEPLRESRADIHKQEFRDYWIRRLSDSHPDDLTAWQTVLRQCLISFIDFAGKSIERVGILHGEEDKQEVRFDLFAMNSRHWWKTSEIRLDRESTVWGVPVAHEPAKLPENVVPAVGTSVAESKYWWILPARQDAVEGYGPLYSIVMIQANCEMPDSLRRFCQLFFDAVWRRDAMTRLFLRERDAHETFGRRVTDVSHDLRTALQHVVTNIEAMLRSFRRERTLSAEENARVDRVWRSVDDEAQYIDGLKPPARLRREVPLQSLSFFDVVREQIDLFKEKALSESTALVSRGWPSKKAIAVCRPADLRRATAALLDNAIKYSYGGKDVVCRGEVDSRHAILTIENYGIGIPPEKLERILERTIRAKVRDPRRRRRGTGLGLAIVAHVFQDLLQGEIEITSDRPAAVEGPAREYHRYVTRVTVRVPVTVPGEDLI